MLRYVCERTFQGRADDIKEYSIAVEALGRPASFDHTRDAIVRVEAHRLRKRLESYYAGEGADRTLRITLPTGGYVPVFAPVPTVAPPATERPAVEAAPAAVAQPARWPWVAAAALLILFAGGDRIFQIVGSSSAAIVEPKGDETIRISAGDPSWGAVDEFGQTWRGDRYYVGGEAVRLADRAVRRCWNPFIHSTMRRGEFRYDIPLQPGKYQVALYFAATEEDVGDEFNVYANGVSWLENFGAFADAGGANIQTVRTFAGVTPAQDGFLHLDFKPVRGEALLSAIEIAPSPDAGPHPIRILAGRFSYLQNGSVFWSADQYFEGGTPVLRKRRIAGAEDQDLFGGERYGEFTYVAPVAPGRYTVRLHFAET